MSDPNGRWRRTAALGALVAGLATAAGAGKMPTSALSDWYYYNNAGWSALNQKKYDRAAQAFKIAIDRVKPYADTERPLLARCYADYARVLYLQKRYDEAAPLARWAATVRESAPGKDAEPLAQTLELLARIEVARRRFGEAAPLFARVLTLREKAKGRDHYELIETVEALAAAHAAQGKDAEAEPLYRRALALRERNADERIKQAEREELSATVMREMAASMGTTGSPYAIYNANARAVRLESSARTLRESTHQSIGAAVTTERYATLLRRTGRVDEADDLDARARAIRDVVETRAARARAGR